MVSRHLWAKSRRIDVERPGLQVSPNSCRSEMRLEGRRAFVHHFRGQTAARMGQNESKHQHSKGFSMVSRPISSYELAVCCRLLPGFQPREPGTWGPGVVGALDGRDPRGPLGGGLRKAQRHLQWHCGHQRLGLRTPVIGGHHLDLYDNVMTKP